MAAKATVPTNHTTNEDLGEAVLIEKLQKHLDIAENTIMPQLLSQISSIETLMSTKKKHFKKLKNDILDRRNQLTTELNSIADAQLKECKGKRKETNKKMKKHKMKLEILYEQYRNEVDERKLSLESASSISVAEANSSFPKEPEIFETPQLQTMTLEQGKTPLNLQEVFGELILRDDQGMQTKNEIFPFPVEVNVTERKPTKFKNGDFTHHSNASLSVEADDQNSDEMLPRYGGMLFDSRSQSPIKSILALEGKAYLWCCRDKEITLVDRYTSTPLRTIPLAVESVINDVTMSAQDDTIWFCCADKGIFEVTAKGKSCLKFKTEEEPLTLLVNRSGKIVIGTPKCIEVYSSDGNLIKPLFLDHAGPTQKLRKMSECPQSHNIAVVCDRSIVVYDENLAKQFTHSAVENGLINREYSCACFDSKGNIVVGDAANKTMIMLSAKGTFLKTLVRKDDDDIPNALSTADDGYIWAGYLLPAMPESAIIEIFHY